MKLLPLVTAAVASSLLLVGITASADDGELLRRSVSSAPGQTEVPEPEGEHAFTKLMNFYVPSQAADGELKEIIYTDADGTDRYTATIAKPIINFYVYGPVIGFEDFSQSGFPGHGRRDAFVAVSLDDGETWKRQNLSDSADKSSFTVATPLPDPGVQQPEFEVTSDTPVTTSALFAERGSSGRGNLSVEGTDAEPKSTVEIRNAITFEVIGTARAKKQGSFSFTLKNPDQVPCSVQAGYTDGNIWGPYAKVVGAPEDCVGPADESLITAYPGDVTNGVHAVAGNYVFAAWQSKFCSAGRPVWSAEYPRDDVAAYLAIDNTNDIYLVDLMGVGGSQGSVDYREQEEFPGEYDGVGEVPYNCVWTARGVLREDPENTGTTEVVWFTAERLTSGRRDANRIEVGCVAGAGCAVSWQEDPEGLRPGEGEGAGTGWAGATTNSQTEVWYSFIEWEDFAIADVDGTATPVALNTFETKPQPYVPMMSAVRLSNNARCPFPVIGRGDYCEIEVAAPYGIKDQCADTVEIPLGPAGDLTPICVADNDGDGDADFPNVANTAASRPRLNLQPRDSDGDGVVDDAWVIVFAEEDKGLGRFGFPNNVEWDGSLTNVGVPCGDPDASQVDDCIEADIGKNIIWYTHALGSPDTSAGVGVDYSLIENILVQGAQLNQPEVNWRTGTFYPPNDTTDMWDFGDYNYLIFNTEIARRSSHMTQSLAKAQASTSGLIAMPLWKQGTLRQGGPADIMARRLVVDPLFDEKTGNPYDVANMKCEYYDGLGGVTAGEVLFADGSNPYYPDGLCTAPAINLSGRTPFECDTGGSSLADGICPALSFTCTDGTVYGQLCVPADTSLESQENPENIQVFDKLLSWYECPGANGANSGTRTDMPTCGSVAPGDVLGTNLDDQSWYMPLEISKAHRGFLDGDFVMQMYAWSPNYKDNKVGRDRYELYSKRSFDGGVTWTTTPASFTASDGVTYSVGAGTTTCETWRDGVDSTTDSHVCNTYAAGEPQQSRNMTQITSMKITTLDPRYTPTIAGMTEQDLSEYGAIFTYEPQTIGESAVQPTDVRDPSRFFIVYENGDNTTVAVGEAEPLDLYYSRGVSFGDHMMVWAEDKPALTLDVCFPNDPKDDDTFAWAAGLGFCNEFDDLEGRRDSLSEEASITSSAAGDFLYGTWGQFNVDADTGDFIDGDAMFRRVWYLDGYISDCCAWTLPGTGTGGGTTTP